MEEQCIEVRHLTKSFSGRRAVDDLSFEVKRGEVFALLGHNGAGKSTTIDLILGLKMPDGGSARILAWKPRPTESRCLNGWGYSFSKPGIRTRSPWRRLVSNTRPCMRIPVTALAVIAVVCGTVSVKTFRWE